MAIITITDLKTRLGITDNVDDQSLQSAVDAATQQIQDYCDRQFGQDTSATARVFVAENPNLVQVDDISTTVGLVVKTDTGEDGNFDTTWTTADYQLEPLNGTVAGQTQPYTAIRAVRTVTFPRNGGEALVQVTARWGWATVPPAVTQAAIIQALNVYKAVDAPFGATAQGDIGIMRLRTGLHPTVEALIRTYRRQSPLVL